MFLNVPPAHTKMEYNAVFVSKIVMNVNQEIHVVYANMVITCIMTRITHVLKHVQMDFIHPLVFARSVLLIALHAIIIQHFAHHVQVIITQNQLMAFVNLSLHSRHHSTRHLILHLRPHLKPHLILQLKHHSKHH